MRKVCSGGPDTHTTLHSQRQPAVASTASAQGVRTALMVAHDTSLPLHPLRSGRCPPFGELSTSCPRRAVPRVPAAAQCASAGCAAGRCPRCLVGVHSRPHHTSACTTRRRRPCGAPSGAAAVAVTRAYRVTCHAAQGHARQLDLSLDQRRDASWADLLALRLMAKPFMDDVSLLDASVAETARRVARRAAPAALNPPLPQPNPHPPSSRSAARRPCTPDTRRRLVGTLK